jgi:hypothetical protein
MEYVGELLKAEFDGARFDARRWCVAGYGAFWFTSEEDAKAAISLAQAHGQAERRRVSRHIRDLLPD